MTSQILSQNYASTERNAGVSVSSNASGFPATNATNKPRRTSVWRSGGHYEITSSNKVLVFQETDGVDLTATLTEGSYSSFEALATEIKTQLDAEGSNTYTVSQDSETLKATIETDGGFLSLIWTDDTGLGDVLGFDTATDDTGATDYTADTLTISTGEYLLFDMGVEVNPDAVVVSWQKDKPSSFSDDTILTIEGNTTNNFSSPQYSSTVSKTEYGFFKSKESGADGLYSTPLRYWKLSFDDTTNPNGYIEVGSIFLGKWLGFLRGAIQLPFNSSWDDGTSTSKTEGGQVIANSSYLTREFSAEWFALTREEKELFDEFYDEHRLSKPFYVMLDPNSVLGSTVGRWVVYVRFSAIPSWSMDIPGVYSLTCQFREEL